MNETLEVILYLAGIVAILGYYFYGNWREKLLK